jgi:hypothetical protein
MSYYKDFNKALSDIRFLPLVYEYMSRLTENQIKEIIDDQNELDDYRSFFPRAGIILAVTAWEVYIESKLSGAVYDKIYDALEPEEVEFIFNRIGKDWLERKPKSPDLMEWAGERWKDILYGRFEDELDRLHTPNSKKLIQLAEHYLDIDITDNWNWGDITPGLACSKLDEIINLRGEIVHGKKKDRILLTQLNEYLDFLEKLAECVEDNSNLY